MRSRLRRIAGPSLAVLGLASYWVAAPWIGDNRQQEFLRAGEAAILTCAFFVFVTSLRRAFEFDVKTSAQRFFLGLILLITGAEGGAVWRLMWRMAGGTQDLAWMLTNDFVGFLLWMQIVGLFLMISGPAVPVYDAKGLVEDERLPWRRLAVTSLACGVVVWVVVVLRPGVDRIHSVIDAVEPYVRPIVWWGSGPPG